MVVHPLNRQVSVYNAQIEHVCTGRTPFTDLKVLSHQEVQARHMPMSVSALLYCAVSKQHTTLHTAQSRRRR